MLRSDGQDDGAPDDCQAVTDDADDVLTRTGIDAVALKPEEHDLSRATALPAQTVAVDYEGRDNLPDRELIQSLAADREVVVTTPVRADGFDPQGDDSLLREWLPAGVRQALVAGHPAYLSEEEAGRAIAPRLGAALQEAPDAWVGTEGVERVAAASGGAQYELLSRNTRKAVSGLRSVGYTGDVAVYAPTVLTDDEDAILDSVGGYVARRGAVARALPDGAATDGTATDRAREVLLDAATDYALVGTEEEVQNQVDRLREAGVTTVVGYPARGLDEFIV